MSLDFERRQKTRKILWRWGNTINDIAKLEREREAFRRWVADAEETLRAQNLDGMPHGNGDKGDLSDVVVNAMHRQEMYREYAEKTEASIRERLRLKSVIDELIQELRPEHERVIAYRYSDGHRWQYIAMKMGYDERQVRRIEAQAVDHISNFVL